MTGHELREGRRHAKLTQMEAARKLAVSQPYLALLESDRRRLPARLARRAATLYRLPATALPRTSASKQPTRVSAQLLTKELAALGYPGFSHVRSRRKRNPAEVLLSALAQNDLEPRLTEALVWVVLRYLDLDWDWLLGTVKQRDLQNRLGFLTTFATRVAEEGRWSDTEAVSVLKKYSDLLEQSRLAKEDTLCHESLSHAEREWLRQRRPEDARHWNLLTDFEPKHFRYAA